MPSHSPANPHRRSSDWSWMALLFLCLLLVPATRAQELSLGRSQDPVTGDVFFFVPASEDSRAQYQWYVDGVALNDAPLRYASELVVYAGEANPASLYQVRLVDAAGIHVSTTLRLDGKPATPPPAPRPAVATRLVNLSVRGHAQQGLPLIAGFVLSGEGQSRLLLRAMGPTLKPLGVNDALSDPTATLYRDGKALKDNNDWDTGTESIMQQVGAYPLPRGSRDSALIAELGAGAASLLAESRDGSRGTALVEIYDAASEDSSIRLINLSSRGLAGNGDDVMILGFTLKGEQSKRVLIRAVGPGLLPLGVSRVLSNPKMSLYSQGQVLRENNDWSDAGLAPEIEHAGKAVGAFALEAGSRDAAMVAELAPGSYSAVVSSADLNAALGEVLVEVYELP